MRYEREHLDNLLNILNHVESNKGGYYFDEFEEGPKLRLMRNQRTLSGRHDIQTMGEILAVAIAVVNIENRKPEGI